MEIKKTTATPNIASNTDRPPKDFSRFTAGAMLNAIVMEKLDAGFYTLKLLDGSLVRARTDNDLQPGQALRLEIAKSGATPEMRIVQSALTGATTPLTIQSALRQLLPKQINPTEFTAALRQAAAPEAETTTPVATAIKAILGSLPTKEDLLTADGVKQAMANSGAFLEAKLASGLTTQGDLKGQLLTLADTLQKALHARADPIFTSAVTQDTGKLPDTYNALLTKTEGAIAHIVLCQLASSLQHNDPQTTWQFSIPFTDGAHQDTVNLKVKREDNGNTARHEPSWSVVLELNPPGMGALNCKICLAGETVNTYFWGDPTTGMAQVEDNLDALAKRYADAGLQIGHLNVVSAASMAQASSRNGAMPTLLDDFA